MPGSTKKKPGPASAPAPSLALRMAAIGLRLSEPASAAALHDTLIEAAIELSAAARVLLVLEEPAGRQLAAARLPQGEAPAALLAAVTPWLDDARRSRRARLRHGPEGAASIDQRSCIVAPLLAREEVLGFLYADIDGARGRFQAADRDLLPCWPRRPPLRCSVPGALRPSASARLSWR